MKINTFVNNLVVPFQQCSDAISNKCGSEGHNCWLSWLAWCISVGRREPPPCHKFITIARCSSAVIFERPVIFDSDYALLQVFKSCFSLKLTNNYLTYPIEITKNNFKLSTCYHRWHGVCFL